MIDDVDGLRRYASRAKRHGYGAMLLVHPKQVDVVAQVFAPTADELEWAEKVIAALEASGGGAVSVDGRMVDAPVIARARRIIETAAVP